MSTSPPSSSSSSSTHDLCPPHAHHHQHPSPPPPPATRWLHCSPLGCGSFGHVSLALNLDDHSLFAIKSCPCSSPLRLSLLNELHILQSLRSPFILRCLGAHFDRSTPSPTLRSLFLEYMDGGSLADLLRRSGGKLSDEALVARYARAILQGLDHLHQNGIVHCDIKSHNILIGSSGVKIADFGAARRIGADSSAPLVDGMIRGTPLYMAPEVAQGVEQGPPSDIWSLGCTVVELLQGRPPWGHIRNVAALFLKLGSTEESVPLPELISAEAEDFLRQCLQRDPKARPTAAELLQHPFVCGSKGSREGEKGLEVEGPGSPRSALEFHGTGQYECYRASAPSMGEKPACSARIPISCRSTESEAVSDDEQWITVKCAGGRGQRQQIRPSFVNKQEQVAAGSSGPAEAVKVDIRKGSEVNFECANFLRNRRRRRRTVG